MRNRDNDADELVLAVLSYVAPGDPADLRVFAAQRFERGRVYRRSEIEAAANGRPVDWRFFCSPTASESEIAAQRIVVLKSQGALI